MRAYIHNFDIKLTLFVQQWRGLEGIMTIITILGHPIVTMGIGLFVVLIGGLRANLRLVYAGFAVFATLGLGTLLKVSLRRDRPLTEYVNNMMYTSFSFPSGHTVGSTVAYGLLAYLAWHLLPHPWGVVVAILLGLFIMVIGMSRIYLGAHFPSDVIAGWVVGLLGLAVIIFIIKPVV
ncbi:MAG TPA: phosphatase PAP2 family protein [Candidatus Saccharimonadales bacterium]|nr:phosphatase PAP2 family protein [Candidatus Saccharimonadales bacterium]